MQISRDDLESAHETKGDNMDFRGIAKKYLDENKTKAQLAKEKAEVEAFFKKRNPFPGGAIDRRMARLMKGIK